LPEKEGLREKLGGWISGRKGVIDTEEALGRTGIDIIKTDTLENRIKHFDDFTAYIQDTVNMKDEKGKTVARTPEEEVTFLAERANGIIGKLHKASIPWGTGGETAYYAEASFGWSSIYTLTLTAIQAVQYLLDQDKKPTPSVENQEAWHPKVDKTALVDSLKYFYFKYYIQYALKISYISWFGRDIVPTKVAMVNNIPQMGSRGVPQGYEHYQETK